MASKNLIEVRAKSSEGIQPQEVLRFRSVTYELTINNHKWHKETSHNERESEETLSCGTIESGLGTRRHEASQRID